MANEQIFSKKEQEMQNCTKSMRAIEDSIFEFKVFFENFIDNLVSFEEAEPGLEEELLENARSGFSVANWLCEKTVQSVIEHNKKIQKDLKQSYLSVIREMYDELQRFMVEFQVQPDNKILTLLETA